MVRRVRDARARLPIVGRKAARHRGDDATQWRPQIKGAAPAITTTARRAWRRSRRRRCLLRAWVPPDGKKGGGKGDGGRGRRLSSASPSGKPGMEPVTRFERELGRRLDIVQSYRGWKADFPAA